jgi:hypothetical protein
MPVIQKNASIPLCLPSSTATSTISATTAAPKGSWFFFFFLLCLLREDPERRIELCPAAASSGFLSSLTVYPP